MNPRLGVACVLLICLVAPMAQAGTIAESLSWFPRLLVDFAEWICDNLSPEYPTNTTQSALPWTVPTG